MKTSCYVPKCQKARNGTNRKLNIREFYVTTADLLAGKLNAKMIAEKIVQHGVWEESGVVEEMFHTSRDAKWNEVGIEMRNSSE